MQWSDAFGRLLTVQELLDPLWTQVQTTSYGYDVQDHLLSVADAVGNVTGIEYDGLGRKQAMRDPDLGHWRYGYDAAGNLTKQVDARGQGTCLYYDALNRLVGKTYRPASSVDGLGCSDSAYTVTYQYDQGTNGKGRRTGMSDGSGDTAWSYDPRGRLLSESKTISGSGPFSTTYTYLPNDQVQTQTYPASGEMVTYGYNARDQVKTVSGSEPYVTGFAYSDLDRPARIDYGNTTQTIYTYYGKEGNFRLHQIRSGTGGSPSVLQDLDYEYDPKGNVTKLKDGGAETRFTYDALDRLLTTGGAYTETYQYDPVGNLTQRGPMTYTYNPPGSNLPPPPPPARGPYRTYLTMLFGGTPYAFPPANDGQPHAVISGTDGFRAAYDANGNMTLRLEDGVEYAQAWDAENRLVAVTDTLSLTVTRFSYDGLGTLVRRDVTNGGSTQSTLYVGQLYEQDLGAAPAERFYYYAGAQRVAVRAGGSVHYLYADHLASIRASSTDGTKEAEQKYYPYGTERPGGTGSLPTGYRFTGQRQDASIGGLYLMGARWYDPRLGRFLSADSLVPEPANPQSLNRYSYAANNPLKFTDPTGHFSEDEIQKYLGVKNWEDVLAQFDKGGKYEGQWGWLEVLRNARINDQVAFYSPSGDPKQINPNQTYRGRFTEGDSGKLMLTDKQGMANDAGVVFQSYSHETLTLFRDSMPGATVRVDNNYVGQWRADQKYSRLKSVNWDEAANPILWEETAELTTVPILAGLNTALLVSVGASVCSTGIGCLAGGPLIVLGGAGGATATILLAKGSIIRLNQIKDEVFIWGP